VPIDATLIGLLCCPATRQAVSPADRGLLDALNARIAGGGLSDAGGRAVTAPLDAGLVREDGGVVYPIRDGIPVMIAEEGVPFPG